MKFLAVAVCALVFAPGALAAYPGTHREVRLEAAASQVAGKPVTVWCGDNDLAWDSFVRSVAPNRTGANTGGYTYFGGSESALSPLVCSRLLVALSPLSPDPFLLGYAVLLLVHESLHAKGLVDESETDCAALLQVQGIGLFYFRVTRLRSLRILRQGAWYFHNHFDPIYRTRC